MRIKKRWICSCFVFQNLLITFVNVLFLHVLWNRNEAFKIRRPSVTLFRRKNHNLNDRILLRYWFCFHCEISTVKTFQSINITCNISSFNACDEITIIAAWKRLLLSKIAFHLPTFDKLLVVGFRRYYILTGVPSSHV